VPVNGPPPPAEDPALESVPEAVPAAAAEPNRPRGRP
jgi:hypothetical protein